ncbi:MAG: signal recognition particle protein [Clostridia bacterium]|jgi:signal recognition particle subunit SRP54|nr:signal recognition particle protein [Clostridia bacterium]
MAFEGLSSRLQEITRKLKGKARITESDLKEVLREVKMALLEADVNYKIVKDFIKVIEEKALGQDVLKSLTPGQQVVKIVKDELVQLLGGEESKISFSPNPPTIIMLVGLQGSGKTTTAGKLANLIRKQGKNPLLVACDVYRPAAIKQLQVVGKQLNIPVYANEQTKDVVTIAKQAKDVAISKLNDVIILDTAGRLHIDENLMQELKNLKTGMRPHEILLVVDSMTGQDAVNVAEKFNTDLGVDGVVLTKLDGDTRGGAALSVKKVTGRPIKFAATGEKLSDIEEFHPERMASRILGMGDILSIIEKAEETFDEEEALKMEQKLKKQSFDLEDYLAQLRQMKKMGSFSSILKMLPGMGALKNVQVDDKEFDKVEAIICSMTLEERRNPKILNGSRRLRIAKGSGTKVQDINKFMNSFEMTQKMMKKFTNNKGAMKRMMKGIDDGNLDLKDFTNLK